jgi:hypothetical protein
MTVHPRAGGRGHRTNLEEAVIGKKRAASCLFNQQVIHKWIFNFQRVEIQ